MVGGVPDVIVAHDSLAATGSLASIPGASVRPSTLERLREWLPEIVLVVVTTIAGALGGGRWLNPFGDPGTWWSLAARLGEGEICYRDVFLQYGPLTPFLLGLWTRAFGLSALSFLVFNWVPAIVLGVLLLRAARPFLTGFERLAALALVLALGLFGAGLAQSRLIFSYCPAAVVALALGVAALLLLPRSAPRAIDPFASGLLAGLAFCAKQEIGIAAAVGLCAPLLTGLRRSGGWFVRCLSSFVIVSAAGLAWAARSASLESLARDSHFWPLGAVPSSWKLLFRMAAGVTAFGWEGHVLRSALGLVVCVLVVGLVALALSSEGRVSRAVPIVLLGAVFCAGVFAHVRFGWRHWDPLCLSMIVAFAMAVGAFVSEGLPRRDFLVGFGLFAGVVAARTAFIGRDWNIYSSVANVCVALVWPIFLLRVVPGVFPPGKKAGRYARRIWAAAILPVAAYSAWLSALSLREPFAVPAQTREGTVWIAAREAPFVALIGRNVRPGERSLILPESNGMEALFGLRSASPLLSHMPGWLGDDAEAGLLRRLVQDPPEVVILFARPVWEFGVAPFGEGFGRNLSAWIFRNYRRVDGVEGVGAILRRGPPA